MQLAEKSRFFTNPETSEAARNTRNGGGGPLASNRSPDSDSSGPSSKRSLVRRISVVENVDASGRLRRSTPSPLTADRRATIDQTAFVNAAISPASDQGGFAQKSRLAITRRGPAGYKLKTMFPANLNCLAPGRTDLW